MNAEVTVYRTAWCPFCQRAEALLTAKTVKQLSVIDIETVPGARAEMNQKTGKTSVPQIFVNGEHIGGCDDLMALNESGKLDSMLSQSS